MFPGGGEMHAGVVGLIDFEMPQRHRHAGIVGDF